MDWSASDYILAAVMLGATGGAGALLFYQAKDGAYRGAFCLALAGLLMLTWSTGAVGIIGAAGDAANLLFALVAGTGLLGALFAQFRPAGLARTLLAMTAVQFLVPVIAWSAGLAPLSLVVQPEVPLATAFFCALWLVSAWLFRLAAKRGSAAREG